MASVRGRRRKSVEEQRVGVGSSRPPDKSEDTATTLTRNELTNNDAITERRPCERSSENLHWLRDARARN